MRRREFIGLLSVGAAVWSLAARAQQKRPVIGFLGIASPATVTPVLLPAFRRGLGEIGFTEGRNVTVEYLWADGFYDRLPALAAEFVNRRVDVIVAAGGSIAGRVAKAATATIPIIALAGDDPVWLGFAASLNRPGGNVTGVVQLVIASGAKRLELLRELVPDAKVIAFLNNPARPNASRQTQDMQAAADALGLRLVVVEADDDDDLASSIAAARTQASALVVAGDPYFLARQDRIVALAGQHALPTMYFFREFVTAGGLISYGSNLANAFHQVGVYAGKVLKGARPGDLPMIQQSDKLELVLNMRTAKALGLPVPATLLAQADEVIE
jgi:putative tryptophan/tyrosine transport system substrate-binding protein